MRRSRNFPRLPRRGAFERFRGRALDLGRGWGEGGGGPASLQLPGAKNVQKKRGTHGQVFFKVSTCCSDVIFHFSDVILRFWQRVLGEITSHIGCNFFILALFLNCM